MICVWLVVKHDHAFWAIFIVHRKHVPNIGDGHNTGIAAAAILFHPSRVRRSFQLLPPWRKMGGIFSHAFQQRQFEIFVFIQFDAPHKCRRLRHEQHRITHAHIDWLPFSPDKPPNPVPYFQTNVREAYANNAALKVAARFAHALSSSTCVRVCLEMALGVAVHRIACEACVLSVKTRSAVASAAAAAAADDGCWLWLCRLCHCGAV